MTDVAHAARRASSSEALGWGARLGLGARATIYVLMGLLALGVATGRSRSETDQRGALEAVARHSGGKVLLVLLALGFLGYALWRLSEAAFGVTGDGDGAKPRIQSLIRAVIYGSFAATTLSILTRSGASKGSQAKQQQDATATVMSYTGGRLLIGIVGLVVLGVGAAMIYEGATKKFMKYLATGQMSAQTRRVVERLGTIGTVARGIVVGLVGVLVVDAAVTFTPDKARGVDGALRTLAAQPYGRTLLVLAALGLITFGVYGFAETRWRRT